MLEFLEYMNNKNDLSTCNCLWCAGITKKDLNKQFANMYKFCYTNVSRFFLIWWENVYSCEYMNDWLELVWSNITVKHWFLQCPEHGRYSWSRLEAYGKSFGRM